MRLITLSCKKFYTLSTLSLLLSVHYLRLRKKSIKFTKLYNLFVLSGIGEKMLYTNTKQSGDASTHALVLVASVAV